jgi:hypothetical protein
MGLDGAPAILERRASLKRRASGSLGRVCVFGRGNTDRDANSTEVGRRPNEGVPAEMTGNSARTRLVGDGERSKTLSRTGKWLPDFGENGWFTALNCFWSISMRALNLKEQQLAGFGSVAAPYDQVGWRVQVLIGVGSGAAWDAIKAFSGLVKDYHCSLSIAEQYGNKPIYTDASSLLARNGSDAASDSSYAARGFGSPSCTMGGILEIQNYGQ